MENPARRARAALAASSTVTTVTAARPCSAAQPLSACSALVATTGSRAAGRSASPPAKAGHQAGRDRRCPLGCLPPDGVPLRCVRPICAPALGQGKVFSVDPWGTSTQQGRTDFRRCGSASRRSPRQVPHFCAVRFFASRCSFFHDHPGVGCSLIREPAGQHPGVCSPHVALHPGSQNQHPWKRDRYGCPMRGCCGRTAAAAGRDGPRRSPMTPRPAGLPSLYEAPARSASYRLRRDRETA